MNQLRAEVRMELLTGVIISGLIVFALIILVSLIWKWGPRLKALFGPAPHPALKALDQSFAQGEINHDLYEQLKRELRDGG